jgi:hypothetical protein
MNGRRLGCGGTWVIAMLAGAAARAADAPTVAYLGVAAQPADPAASAAAGLPAGVGLTVTFVEPTGPAAAGHAVRAGDLLQKLDDQLLVNLPQMVTLVQLHRPGDAVMLTVVRDGRPLRATVKLGERRRPEPRAAAGGDDEPIPTLPGVLGPDPVTGRLPDDPQLPLPGTARTSISFDDGTYSARVSGDGAGHKTMVVTDADGRVVASGPVDTPEQWNAFPADVRQHLQSVRKLLDGNRKGSAHTSGHHPRPSGPADATQP